MPNLVFLTMAAMVSLLTASRSTLFGSLAGIRLFDLPRLVPRYTPYRRLLDKGRFRFGQHRRTVLVLRQHVRRMHEYAVTEQNRPQSTSPRPGSLGL